MKTKIELAVQRAQMGQRSTYRKARGPHTNPDKIIADLGQSVNRKKRSGYIGKKK